MSRPRQHGVKRSLLLALLVLAASFGGCRPTFFVSPEELERSRSLPPDAPIRGLRGEVPVVLRAAVVQRSVIVSHRGDFSVEDPGLNLRRAAWGVGGAAIGLYLVFAPITSASGNSDANPFLVQTLIAAALTGMAIGLGTIGNLEETDFLFSDDPLPRPQAPRRSFDDYGQRRSKQMPATSGVVGH